MADGIILFDWKILTGSIVILLSFTCIWGYKIWYTYLQDKEDEVNKKIENEVDSNGKNYEKMKEDIGMKEYANRLLNLIKLKDKVIEGKNLFEKNMLFSGIAILLSGIAYSLLSYNQELLLKYQNILLIVLGICVMILVSAFCNLYKSKQDIEKYLRGIPIEEIFEQERANFFKATH